MSATLHALKRVGKPLWGPTTGTTWFWKESFIGTQPLANVLSLPVFLLQQQRWVLQQRQHTKPTIFPNWIFSKKKSLLTPDLKRQKSIWHRDGRTMQASQGRKAGLWGGKGEHRGDDERKGLGRQVGREAAWREMLASKTAWEGVQASEGSTPHLEIISRNLQTWVQILVCIKQLLKLLFSFVRPDGPESPERRC